MLYYVQFVMPPPQPQTRTTDADDRRTVQRWLTDGRTADDLKIARAYVYNKAYSPTAIAALVNNNTDWKQKPQICNKALYSDCLQTCLMIRLYSSIIATSGLANSLGAAVMFFTSQGAITHESKKSILYGVIHHD